MHQDFLLPPSKNIRSERIPPIIKWAGGKEAELKYILPNLPKRFDRYFEPFVGGGAVFFSIDADEMLINDKSEELMTLYRFVQAGDLEFLERLKEINKYWRLLEQIIETNASKLLRIYSRSYPTTATLLHIKDIVTEFVLENHEEFSGILNTSFNLDIDNFIHEVIRNMTNKISRMKAIKLDPRNLSRRDILDNLESALKSAFYMHFRHLYNKRQAYEITQTFAAAIFYFVREFCYASMFRYNSRGEFNVPYGGIQYNRKDFLKKILALSSERCRTHLRKTRLFNVDFEDFLRSNRPRRNDFMFIDPPYDSDFSTYAKNAFGMEDQFRLARCLSKTSARFMLIIKRTDSIAKLYSGREFHIRSFDKRYFVSFQDRNNKNAEHLLITNYGIEGVAPND